MSTIQHARPVWMHSFCAPRHSAPTWDYVGQSKSQMRLAIARGISLCASGGCAARACSRAARLEASEKCNPWVCAIQMPGGEPLSLTRGRACPVMVCHGAHESLEAGLGVARQCGDSARSTRICTNACTCTCTCTCTLGVHMCAWVRIGCAWGCRSVGVGVGVGVGQGRGSGGRGRVRNIGAGAGECRCGCARVCGVSMRGTHQRHLVRIE